MQRREFIALLGASAAWPIAGYAQQPGKIFRIGFLGFGSATTWANRIEALHGGLRDLGYVDGRTPPRALQKKRPAFIKSAPACSLRQMQSSQANSGCMRPELGRVLR